MSISTKTGDDGTTGLWSGERIGKDELRVECYGTVDELDAFLGFARRAVGTERIGAIIDVLQEDLLRVAGSLASTGNASPARSLLAEDEERLSAWVYELEAELPLRGFVVPGSTESSARLDLCRTVCRRAERLVVGLSRRETVDTALLRYLNRLSDLLFLCARFEEAAVGAIRYKGRTSPLSQGE